MQLKESPQTKDFPARITTNRPTKTSQATLKPVKPKATASTTTSTITRTALRKTKMSLSQTLFPKRPHLSSSSKA